MIRPFSTLKQMLDQAACRDAREPDEVVTTHFKAEGLTRFASARRNPEGGYDVAVFVAKKGFLVQHFKKTHTLHADAGLVRAVIILDDWQRAQRSTDAVEDTTPSFGGGALVDNVATAKGWRQYLGRG